VQTDSCVRSEQIDTLFISGVSGRGVWGVGGHFGPEAPNIYVHRNCFFLRILLCVYGCVAWKCKEDADACKKE